MSADLTTLTTTPAETRPREQQTRVPRLAAMLIMGVFTVYFLTPLWWLFVGATKNRDQFTGTNPLWFADLHLVDNLRELIAYRDGVFLQWTLNSVAYTGGAALLGTLLAAMCGYALAKYRFPGRELIFNVVLSGVLVPATALALPLFLIFSQFQAANTFWAVFLPSLVNPFGVYLARVYAASGVPDGLLEAARIDGAGEVRTFFTISARLMSPALVTIFLFHFVAVWNNFLLPLIMLSDERLFPLTLGLYSWNTQITQVPELRGMVIVGSLISIAPLAVAFLMLQRFWRTGISTGAVK
jgi:multiple sugar transport system permease protein